MGTQKIQIVQPIYEESYSIQVKRRRIDECLQGYFTSLTYTNFLPNIYEYRYFIKTELTNTGKVQLVHQDKVFPMSLKAGSHFNLGTPCEPKVVKLNQEYVEADGSITFVTSELVRVGCPTTLQELTIKMMIKQAEEDERVAAACAKRRRDIEEIEAKSRKEEAKRTLTDRQKAKIAKLQAKIREMDLEVRAIRKY